MLNPLLRHYLDKIKAAEGDVPHMYVGAKGLVTVGVGHNLSAHRDATFLKWQRVRPSRKALTTGISSSSSSSASSSKAPPPRSVSPVPNAIVSSRDIQDEFNFLTQNAGTFRAPSFQITASNDPQKPYTTLEMSDTDRDRLFQNDLENHVQLYLRTVPEFAQYDKYPIAAQAALLDLIFNVGDISKWTSLRNAYAAGDWLAAAKESHRREDGLKGLKQRNLMVRSWLESVYRETKSSSASTPRSTVSVSPMKLP